MEAVNNYKFGDMTMEVRLHGMGRVDVELTGYAEGTFIDGVITWSDDIEDKQELRMISGAIRGKNAEAEELCKYLTKRVLAQHEGSR